MAAQGDADGSAVDATSSRLVSRGEFARRSRLSIKALRLYEARGLLTPARVDPDNGYRWYQQEQLFTARLIGMLRALDVPLTEIARIVAEPADAAAQLVAAHWDAVERRVAAQRGLADLLVASMRDGDGRVAHVTVQERDVPEQLLLSTRRRVPLAELETWLPTTRRRLLAEADEHGGAIAGPIVIYHGQVDLDNDGPVEVGVPVDPAHTASRSSGVELRREPAHREAFAATTKARFEFPHILSVYDAVAAWIEAQGRRSVGTPREIYPLGLDPATAAPTDHVCDVAYPIEA